MPELPLITIDRIIERDFGVYGTLAVTGNDFKCFTLERPNLGNTPWLSCIPTGLYHAHRGEFSRGRPPYADLEIESVAGRDNIEVHAANLPSEVNGCIAPVENLRHHNGVIYGSNSKQTLARLLDSFDTDDIHILIRSTDSA